MTSQAFQNLLSQFRAAPLDPHVGLSGLWSAFDTMGFSLSPCTDHAQTGESIRTKADVDPLISSELITVCTQHYLGSSVDVRNPLASPLYATLTGLPPMLIMVGSAEVLLDDSVRLADKARAQGVDADLVVADDMTHTWPFFAGAFPEAQEGVELIASYIRRQLS